MQPFRSFDCAICFITTISTVVCLSFYVSTSHLSSHLHGFWNIFWERNQQYSFLFLSLFILRESTIMRGTEREGERESQAGSILSVQSPTRGPIPRTVRSWPEPKSRVGHLTDWATQGTLAVLVFKAAFSWRVYDIRPKIDLDSFSCAFWYDPGLCLISKILLLAHILPFTPFPWEGLSNSTYFTLKSST